MNEKIYLKNIKHHYCIAFPEPIFKSDAKKMGDILDEHSEFYRWILKNLELVKNKRVKKNNDDNENEQVGNDLIGKNEFYIQFVPKVEEGLRGYILHIFSNDDDFFQFEISNSIKEIVKTNDESKLYIDQGRNDLNVIKNNYMPQIKMSQKSNIGTAVFKNKVPFSKKRKRNEFENKFSVISTKESFVSMIKTYKYLSNFGEKLEDEIINIKKKNIQNILNLFKYEGFVKKIMKATGHDVDIMDGAFSKEGEGKFNLDAEYIERIEMKNFSVSNFEKKPFPFGNTKEIQLSEDLSKFQIKNIDDMAFFLTKKDGIQKKNDFLEELKNKLGMEKTLSDAQEFNKKNVITLIREYAESKYKSINQYIVMCETKRKRNDIVYNILWPFKKKMLEDIKLLMEPTSNVLYKDIPYVMRAMLKFKNDQKEDGKIFLFTHSKCSGFERKTINGKNVIEKEILEIPFLIPLFDEELDASSNFIIHYLAMMRDNYHINNGRNMFIFLMACYSVFSTNKLKMNILISGPFGVGKSYMINVIISLLIYDTWKNWSTSPSPNSMFTENGHLSDFFLIFMHEAGQFYGLDLNVSMIRDLYKTLLTEGQISKEILNMTVDGKRPKLSMKIDKSVMFFVATNLTKPQMDPNLCSRHMLFPMKCLDSSKIKEGMNMNDITEMLNVSTTRDFEKLMKTIHFLMFFVYICIRGKVIMSPVEINKTILLSMIENYFLKNGTAINENPRTHEQLSSLIRVMTILHAILVTYLVPGGKHFNCEFKYESIFDLEKHLFVKMQTVVSAVCLCFHTLQNQPQSELINHVFEKCMSVSMHIRDFEESTLTKKVGKKNDKKSEEKKKREEKGFNKVEVGRKKGQRRLEDINYRYDLFGIHHENKDSDISFRRVVINKKVYYDLNYLAIKVKSIHEFCEKEKINSNLNNMKETIYSYMNTSCKPKHVLKYVEVDEFEKKCNAFCDSNNRVNNSNFDISLHEMDELLRSDPNFVEKGGDYNAFEFVDDDNNYYISDKFPSDKYNQDSGLKNVIRENWNKKFDENLNSDEKFPEAKFPENTGNTQNQNVFGNEKWIQLCFNIDLRRTDYKKVFKDSLKNMEYKGLKRKKFLLPFSDSKIHETIILDGKNKKNHFKVKNDMFINEEKSKILKSVFCFTKNKDFKKQFKFRSRKEYTYLDNSDDDENDSENKKSKNQIFEDYDSDDQIYEEKTYKKQFDKMYDKENVKIKEDLDDFSEKLARELSGDSYKNIEKNPIGIEKIYEKYKNEMKKGGNEIYDDIFEHYKKWDVKKLDELFEKDEENKNIVEKKDEKKKKINKKEEKEKKGKKKIEKKKKINKKDEKKKEEKIYESDGESEASESEDENNSPNMSNSSLNNIYMNTESNQMNYEGEVILDDESKGFVDYVNDLKKFTKKKDDIKYNNFNMIQQNE